MFGKKSKVFQPAKIAAAIQASQRSWDDFMATINVVNSNVVRRDFVAAEAERERLHALLDDYIDNYMIAGKLSLGEEL